MFCKTFENISCSSKFNQVTSQNINLLCFFKKLVEDTYVPCMANICY